MLSHNLSQIAQWCGGSLQGEDAMINSVSIDSRKLGVKALFIALRGEQVDGHDFVDKAQQAGASAALVSKPQETTLSQIVVADTEKALAAIAAAYRQQYQGKVLAITGSSGKTTTRNMLSAILREKGLVSETIGNFNNDLGLPLSILAADLKADYWVLEMGAAQLGDINRLMAVAKPEIAAVTQVGVAHIGRFGSQQAIAQAKGEIFQLGANGLAVVNQDDVNVVAEAKKAKANSLSFSINNESADVWVSNVELAASSSQFVLHYGDEHAGVKLPIAGQHNIANALCASACAIAAGANLLNCKNGLAKCWIEQGRLAVGKASTGASVIDDSYNANPQSVMAAIDVLALYSQNKVLVLGDMGELGESSGIYHQQMGEYAKQKKIDEVLTVGEQSQLAQQVFGAKARHFSDKKALLAYLLNNSSSGDVILVKGSRSAGMEQIVQGLKQEETTACC